MADRVVPNSLNYTDIKPEVIESEIKLVKFQPTATINGVKGGDMIKFMMTGNGFFDPYSSYFSFQVTCSDLATNEVRFLDRSAHSFIQRMIIRSQGVELERIENYDVAAAMINDMIYSPEQNSVHCWEGFPTQQLSGVQRSTSNTNNKCTCDDIGFAANAAFAGLHLNTCNADRQKAIKLLNQGSNPDVRSYCGECAFWNADLNFTNTSTNGTGGGVNAPLDSYYIQDYTYSMELQALNAANYVNPIQTLTGLTKNVFPMDYTYHSIGQRVGPVTPMALNAATVTPVGTNTLQFIIPIYSGLIGVLMPDKKLLPLNLLPLDIEIYFNPFALYSSGTFTQDATHDPLAFHAVVAATGTDCFNNGNTPLTSGSRNYTIQNFNIYSHMIFFEQDIHRSLEAAVAEHGIFIYCNSFHQAPMALISSQSVPSTQYISMNLKSINSVHILFYYNHFETKATARKLHFVSHNLTWLQILNGTELIPQYAIEGHAGTSQTNAHVPFIVELMKSWNKLHDPQTDGALCTYNFCGDEYAGQMDAIPISFIGDDDSNRTLCRLVNKQSGIGRCQYGVSLEGEELGQDQTMITGRKSQYPFLVQMKSDGKFTSHTSYMLTFLRADYVVYIRPDLQIVTLGK